MVLGTSTQPNLKNGNGPLIDPGERLMNPAANMGVTNDLSENIILTTVDDLYNWTRLSSLFPLYCTGRLAALLSLQRCWALALTLTGLVSRLGPAPDRPI